MSDGATFRMPSAVRVVGDTLQLERDPHNHPVYLVRARWPGRTALGPNLHPGVARPPKIKRPPGYMVAVAWA